MARRPAGSTTSRRINGQGTVTHDKARGRWRAQFYDDDGNRRSLTARTRADAETALRQAQALRDQGGLSKPPSETPTLGDWLGECVEDRAASVAPSTATHYRLAATRIARHIGEVRLDKVSARDIRWYQRQERARGLSEGSLLSDHRVLKRALADALRDRLLSSNPLEGVRAPKPQRRPANPLTEAEYRSVLEQAREDGPMAYAMRRLALMYGPRQSEVLGLKWTDLNLTSGHRRIQRALRRDAGVGRHEKSPKSSEGTRTLPLERGDRRSAQNVAGRAVQGSPSRHALGGWRLDVHGPLGRSTGGGT
jgi:integrase